MSSFLRHLGSLVAATIMALPAMPLPAHAQIQGRDPTPEEIVGMMLVDVPLVLDAIDPAVQASHLWVKRDQPTETLLARFTMKPVQVAQIDGGAPGGQDAALLWRAFTGEEHATPAPQHLTSRSRGAGFLRQRKKDDPLLCRQGR